jgi:hypothetical protein
MNGLLPSANRKALNEVFKAFCTPRFDNCGEYIPCLRRVDNCSGVGPASLRFVSQTKKKDLFSFEPMQV